MTQATVSKLKPPVAESTKIERARALQEQASRLLSEVVSELFDDMEKLICSLEAVSTLESVKPGVKDMAGKLSVSLRNELTTMQSIQGRDL